MTTRIYNKFIFKCVFLIFIIFISITGAYSINAQETLLAGSVKVDITPNPGKALAGYSLLSGEAVGVRHHLYARILYLAPKSGDEIIFVQLDLLSGSILLHNKLASGIGKELNISGDCIVITANHTHSAPGNFMGSEIYNMMDSSNSGFDKEYFDFLLNKITMGIREARTDLYPAVAGSGKIEVKGYTKNRSLDAFLANPEIDTAEIKPDDYDAVNPVMQMLRVDRLSDEGWAIPVAALTSYSIHGTAVPASNRYYSADVFTYISRELQWRIEDEYGTQFNHLVSSMVQGDISPAYAEGKQGFDESERIGIALGQEAVRLHSSLEKKLSSDISIKAFALNVDLLNRTDDYQLSERAYFGAPATGGAEDGRNEIMRIFPSVREGAPASREIIEGQGFKRPILGHLQGLIFPAEKFPHNLIVQVIVIDKTAYIPLPFEVTGIAGYRLENVLKDSYLKKTDISLTDVTVLSCSNGYFGYLTTEEEYNQQHYEGGSNLYGPQTLSFISSLITNMSWGNWTAGSEWTSASIKYPTSILSQPPNLRRVHFDGNSLQSVDFIETDREGHEAYWSFRWKGSSPQELDFARSIVHIEKQADDLLWYDYRRGYEWMDDLGYSISVELIGQDRRSKECLYETRWYFLPTEDIGNFRFVVIDSSENEVKISEDFGGSY